MKTIFNAISFVIRLIFGVILYIFDESFRALVNAKMRVGSDTVAAGETVQAVLNSGTPEEQKIGG